ncbi:UDP-N-acetylmuramoyl-L-alanyl-D-glutamate--2,6-diaminopimelate ligase [Actinotalea solisilvae]|uniref:UDP-N-acetylmuramoyl-L-alanyl-D-glutamate--2, 6-diaminopimelate ligase n=1 Tax=Actinotalea solisilvae TaxID=2072922 RepID=UPI0018F23987|nr:UDP-N-acetylmuramoyl-L-alanyl-D-glutamate--2,6-diaminopimelate ligase [Actinotalea solisilvae]
MTSPQGRMRPEHRPTRHLPDLVARFGLVVARGGADASAAGAPGDARVDVTGVAVGSADVLPGDLFVALPGLRSHGARYARAAVDAGAAALLTDAAGVELLPPALGVPVLTWPDGVSGRTLLGELSAWFYEHPAERLTVVGITGTNGKTTTCYFVDAALRTVHPTTAVVGTVELRVGAEAIESPRTTVEAPVLHGLFALMGERGATACAMEVSSHALALERVGGLRVDVAGFTNLQRDHLDFHGDMEGYFRDKARLFAPGSARRGVVCVDDAWGARLAAEALVPVDTVATRPDAVGGASAGWRVSDASVGLDGVGSTFVLTGPDGERVDAASPLPGLVNVSNAALAIVLAHRAGVPLAEAVAGVAGASAIPGRMERVVERGPGRPLCLVDYAHTPDALVLALEAVRPVTPGRLLLVLGSDGDRDQGKRPIMGEIAARLADVVVVTDENPRSEVPADIRAAILDGARAQRPDLHDVHEVEPRAEAIRVALRLAREGDTVIVTGKGHEPTQEVAGVFHRYNDRDVFLAAVAGTAPGDAGDAEGADDRQAVDVLDATGGATVDSVRAALRDLAVRAGAARSIAVVGALAGPGARSVDELDGIGRLAVRLDIDRLVAVGDGVRAVHTGAFQEGSWGEESRHVADAAAAAAWLSAEVRPGDVVLVADADGALAPVVAAARGVAP